MCHTMTSKLTWLLLYLGMSMLVFPQLASSVGMNSAAEPTEYCQFETLNATCRHDEVIVMTMARYGRMRFGRCVDRDYGYVGCSSDVLVEVDGRCSGRRTCSLPVPDALLHSLHACPKDLSAYLQASFICQPVTVSAVSSSCPDGSVPVAGNYGFLSSLSSFESGHGTDTCPWVLRVTPGHRINLTLWDFTGQEAAHFEGGSTEFCKAYAIVREKESGTSTTICGGQQRKRIVYVSRTNEIEIRLIYNPHRRNKDVFLLQYEAFGCTSLKTPEGARIQYSGQLATISCDYTSQKWTLECRDQKWYGQLGNCSKAWGVQQVMGSLQSMPTELTIALVIGIALFVVVLVLGVGLYCIRRRRMEQTAQAGGLMGLSDSFPYSGDGTMKEKTYTPQAVGGRGSRTKGSIGDYAAIWESQYHPTLPSSLPHDPRAPPFSQNQYGAMPNMPSIGYAPQAGTGYPPVEHLYESPKFERHAMAAGPGGLRRSHSSELPVYYELDPDNPMHPGQGSAAHHGHLAAGPHCQLPVQHGTTQGPCTSKDDSQNRSI